MHKLIRVLSFLPVLVLLATSSPVRSSETTKHPGANGTLWQANDAQMARNYPEALSLYEKYIQFEPHAKEAAIARAAIAAIHANLRVVPDKWYRSLSARDIYLIDTIQEGVWRWPNAKMPLKVYVTDSDPRFTKIVRTAMEKWQTATRGLVSFELDMQPENADVVVSFTTNREDPDLLASEAATHRSRAGEPQKATVNVLLVRHYSSTLLPDDALANNLTHEFGHALGLGNSKDPHDIMCHNRNRETATISAGDRYMLQQLYTQSPSALATRALEAVNGIHAPHDFAYANLLRIRGGAFVSENQPKQAGALK